MIDVRGLVGEDDGAEGVASYAGARPPLPEVFVELAPRLRRLAARRVGENLADDVVQETFLRAHRAYDRYVDDGRTWAWVRNIAEHVCIDLVLRSRIEAAAVERVSSYRHPSSADETFASVEAREDRMAMAAVLAQLQPRQRRVLVLRDFHGWSTYEVATALGMTIDGVKATLKRARGSFRTAYAGLAGGRYVAGVLGAIAAMRRALRRATAATTGSVNVVLVSALVVVTTLALSLPIVPFQPDIDAVREGVTRSTSSSGAPPARGRGGALASPMRPQTQARVQSAPGLEPSLGGADGAAVPAVAPAASRGLVPVWVDDNPAPAVTDKPHSADDTPPPIEVEADLSPTCDLAGHVNLDETCSSLDQDMTVGVPHDGNSESGPLSLLPLNPMTRSSLAVPTSAAIAIRMDRPDADIDETTDAGNAGETSDSSTTEEEAPAVERVEQLPLVG